MININFLKLQTNNRNGLDQKTGKLKVHENANKQVLYLRRGVTFFISHMAK